MPLAAVILVEPSMAGNLGAAIRVAANFRVPRLDLVRPAVPPDDSEVRRWACGGADHLTIRCWDRFEDAVSGYRTLAATASGRGRDHLPVLTPPEAVARLRQRGADDAALIFGNETRGLCRRHVDRADLVIRIPTAASFPVLNLTQSVAVLLGYLAIDLAPAPPSALEPAPTDEVEGLMGHLGEALFDIGFADPGNPDRIQRKLRRLFGRAGITSNEVKIVRGICRQMQWAARTDPTVVATARKRSLDDS
jgi:TrmH family RNA methyltransferase